MNPWTHRSPAPRLSLGTYGLPLLPRRLVLRDSDVAAHKHVMGVTGQGKSKLLASLVSELVLQDVGCCLIDPHADLAEDVLAHLLSRGYFDRPGARERLWYVDFSRSDRFLPFNILNQPGASPHAVAQHVAEVCKRAWAALADGAAPQFENIILAAVVVLADNGLSLTGLQPLLTDKLYRDALLKHVRDRQIVEFFYNRFDRWGRDAPIMIESTLRRVFLLTFSPALRYCLGQQANLLDFRRLMDSGRVLLVNLGGLDEDTQRFLGCLLTVGFETAALSRADIPERERRPFHLVMDEFSMFSAQSEEALARVLSLARKYKLTLTLAHQTWSQLSSRLQGALQNCVDIAFQLGPADALVAARRFGRFDPYVVKHEVDDSAAVERTHPLYFSVQETFERWATSLVDLVPRNAYVALGRQTYRIRTTTFPAPTCTQAELTALKEEYARRLLTAREDIERGIKQATIPVAPPALSRRAPVE